MANPGKIAKYALPKSIYLKCSLIIEPQLGIGGWVPIPKKLNPLSIKIEAAKVNLNPIKRIGGKSSIAGFAMTKPKPKNIGTKDAISESLIVKN